MYRPLALPAFAFLGGLYASAYVLSPGLIVSLVIFLSALLFFLFFDRYRVFLIGVCFFACGCVVWDARVFPQEGDELSEFVDEQNPTTIRLRGVVCSTNLLLPHDEHLQAVVQAQEVYGGKGWSPIQGRFLIRWYRAVEPLFVGDRVTVVGRPTTKLSFLNPGIDAVQRRYHQDNIFTLIRCSTETSVRKDSCGTLKSFAYWVSRLRQLQGELLAEVVPESVMPFVAAVWLGHRVGLSQNELDSFVFSGTAHILAVSGIHVGVVFLSTAFLVSLFVRSPRKAAGIILGVVFLFCLLAGARASVMRAAVMVGFYLLADFFDRERDTISALAATAIVLPSFTPTIILDPGFQLSFLSVASILSFHERVSLFLQDRARLPRFLSQPIATTFSAQILPLPLTVKIFHVLPLLVPLVNLIVVPLLGVVLWLCLLTSFVVWLNAGVGLIFGHALLPFVECIRWLVGLSQRVPGSYTFLTSPTSVAMAFFWAALFPLVIPMRARQAALRWFGVITLFTLCFLCWKPRLIPEVVFLDVGHGDSIFFQWNSGKTLLVDGGDSSDHSDLGASVVCPFLWQKGITRLDYVICTHPDRDHIGGLLTVFERFDVGEIFLGVPQEKNPLEKALLEQCRRRDISVRFVSKGDRVEFEDGFIEILNPVPEVSYSNSNDGSVVACVGWSGIRFLLTGDVGRRIADSVAVSASPSEVLKIPHHASTHSYSAALLDKTNPLVAVVTGGTSLSAGLGSNVWRKELSRRGVAVFNMTDCGAVRFRQLGEEIEVTAQRPRDVTSISLN